MKYDKEIETYITREIETLRKLNREEINCFIHLLEDAFYAEKNIYIFGNGGSASTASHYANDFNKGISEFTEKKFRFICLNDNVPTIMAIANDIGYEEIFRFQLQGHLLPGDIVIGISGGGNSKNVLNAVSYAKEHGIKTVGITGGDGGKLKNLADISIHVPADSLQITEDIHLILNHLIMSVFHTTLSV